MFRQRPAIIMAVLFWTVLISRARAEILSPLAARGYTVLPVPQQVTLGPKDFMVTNAWQLVIDRAIKPEEVAVESLKQQWEQRFGWTLAGGKAVNADGSGTIRLMVRPGSVVIGEATDRNRPGLSDQAYHLTLKPQEVTLITNSSVGLFYGVQTLIQLVRYRGGRWWLPEGEITDWPDLEMRIIYWDDAHHLEPLHILKEAVRQAVFYKINGFAIKLEGHFQYKSAAPIVEPYALSAAEFQELTEYGSKYHIQVIPYLDAPSHIAFILKHPEYAGLREFPESNYEECVTNPDIYKLYFGMFDELLEANRGGKYFVLSTDEPYYVGLAKNSQCNEVDRARELGSVGKLLAEFVTKTSNYLHDRGRTVLFWGEYPLKPEDIGSLPSHLVNSEVYGPEFDPVFKSHGIRQMIFTSTVGWKEFLFSNYYLLPSADHLPGAPGGAYESVAQGPGYVGQMLQTIENTPARKNADLMGTFVAGWADTGIHPEVMWLGYATGSAAGWHPKAASEQELMNSFYPLFYGPGATKMGRIYQLMSEQGQFWKESWATVASNARTPIWGDWDRINQPPQPAEDQTLPLPSVPSSEVLRPNYDWAAMNERRLQMAGRFLAENDELLDLLLENLRRVEFNRYNLELYVGIAQLYRQNVEMLMDLGRIDKTLKAAHIAASKGDAKTAITAVDRAFDIAEKIRQQRNQAFANAVASWYKSWYPRVAEANGRRFVDRVDDVKDHLPVRTVDMTYLIYRQLLYPLGQWASDVQVARNQYAQAHGLPNRTATWNWKETAITTATGFGDGERQ
jgi:hexosaminidase